MKHVVEAGTDAAALLIYEPALIPPNHDDAEDPSEIFVQLDEQKKLFWINTGTDGAFLLHAFVDEDPPEEWQSYLKDPRIVERLTVVAGRICFSGAEFGRRDTEELLKDFPHMGSCFSLVPGEYHTFLYRAEFPEDSAERAFKRRASWFERTIHESFGWMVVWAMLSVPISLVSFFLISLATWLTYVLPIVTCAILLPFVAYHLPVYRTVNALWDECWRERPSMVLVLRRRIA